MYSFWNNVMDELRKKTLSASFSAFIEPLYIHHIDDDTDTIFLAWPQEERLLDHINNKYHAMIESSINEVQGKEYKVIIKTEQELKDDTGESRNKKETTTLELEKLFNPRFRFENFIVGNSNRLAHAVSLAVAEAPGELYNPLFLYGDSGLGKTHLMQAIGIHIIRNNPSEKVLYVSSEMFTNELITSLNKKNPRAFRNKYRKLDVLLIDDIQFLEGKEATQEEFFHTFEALYQSNRQIVITSDRPPVDLKGLDDRLITRFSGNMIADVKAPDYETRVAILQNYAQKAGIEMTHEIHDVLCYIAEKVKDNVRELEGSFNRVVAFSTLLEEEITLDNVIAILKDAVKDDEQIFVPEKIRSEVARYYHVDKKDMDSKKRNAEITLPRMVAMYIIRENSNISLPEIGKLFGGRDHSTVIHSIKKIENKVKTDPQIHHDVEVIIKKIKE